MSRRLSLALVEEVVGAAFRPADLVSVTHRHAPLALKGGRTVVRVVARGTGVLEVGDVRRVVWGEIDEDFLVEVAPVVPVSFRTAHSRVETRLRLGHLVRVRPARVVVDPLDEPGADAVAITLPKLPPRPAALAPVVPSRRVAPVFAVATPSPRVLPRVALPPLAHRPFHPAAQSLGDVDDQE